MLETSFKLPGGRLRRNGVVMPMPDQAIIGIILLFQRPQYFHDEFRDMQSPDFSSIKTIPVDVLVYDSHLGC
jgi:hypothetical protein